jgi:RHH-type rel operon transcriptional repressor/antitoxin RelB
LPRKKSNEKLKVVAVRIGPAVERRLRLLAQTSGRKQSFFLQQLIDEGLGKLEEAWLPAALLAQVRAGRFPEPEPSHVEPDLFDAVPQTA